MRDELKPALLLAQGATAEELPRLLGDLEEIRATAFARLTAPAVHADADELLEVPEAAERLGVSNEYLYRNHKRLPFTRRMGRKLLFSSAGLSAYVRRAK